MPTSILVVTWFEETSARGFIHADARVSDGQLHTAVIVGLGAYGNFAAVGHGVDGVQQQVGQDPIQTADRSANVRDLLQLQQHLDGDTG